MLSESWGRDRTDCELFKERNQRNLITMGLTDRVVIGVISPELQVYTIAF